MPTIDSKLATAIVKAIAEHGGDNTAIDPTTGRPVRYAIALSDADLLAAMQARSWRTKPVDIHEIAKNFKGVK